MSKRNRAVGMHMIQPEPDSKNLDKHTFEPSYIPKFKNADSFIADKIKILRDHFKIDLTDEDIAYLCEFKTENEINTAVKRIINKYWE